MNLRISFVVAAAAALSLVACEEVSVETAEPSGTESVALAVDGDQDGLSDHEELQLGTDPNLLDTDGDGLADLIEVTLSYDPLDPLEPIIEDVVIPGDGFDGDNIPCGDICGRAEVVLSSCAGSDAAFCREARLVTEQQCGVAANCEVCDAIGNAAGDCEDDLSGACFAQRAAAVVCNSRGLDE